MNRRKALSFAALLVLFALTSCSGPKTPCTTNCVQNGNATVSMTMIATPLTPPPGTNILSMTAAINGVTLTPTTGSAQNLNLPVPFEVDFTRLQSDSVFLGTLASIPAGTYTITVSVTGPVLYYCTQPNPGTQGCAAGSVAKFTGSPATPAIPTTLVLTTNQKTGLAINFNLQNAITVNTGQVVTGINLNATNAVTANALPSSSNSLASGQLDFVEDITGVVTKATASTQAVTIQTAAHGSFTASANSSTVYSPTSCSTASFACVTVGQIASVDAALNTDGSLTIIEYDPLSTTTNFDVIEGVVTAPPSSSTQFQLVANDLVQASSGSLLSGSLSTLLGAPVNITLITPSGFTIDSKGLTIPTNTFSGTDASILVPGQTVAVAITSFTAASGNILASANANALTLRFSRVTGTSGGTGLQFPIQNLPPFFGQTLSDLVQVTQGSPPSSPSTNYDGVNPSTNPITSGQTVSIRALYFGPSVATPFSAAKVRVP